MRKFWHKLKRVKKYANEFLEWSERYFFHGSSWRFSTNVQKKYLHILQNFYIVTKRKKAICANFTFLCTKNSYFLFVILFNLITSEIAFFQREEEINKNPLSKPEGAVEQTAAEILYAAMLPSLPQVILKKTHI